MTPEEYLHTSFENPDPEFLDGEVVKRNGGTLSHSRTLVTIGAALFQNEKRTGLRVVLSLRLRIAPNRIRVADITVFAHEPAEELPSNPPLVAIEILSPDDRIGYVIPKLEEYRRWGVKHIWSVDPEDRKLFTYGETGLHEVGELRLPEFEIAITLAEIFGAL
jgi:Uma2 family endonuclease